MEIYLDFDGTMVEHIYPKIGRDNPMAIDVVKELQKQHKIVLNTYRANLDARNNNGTLSDALEYLRFRGIRLDDVLQRKDMPPTWNLHYFQTVNRVYIDDAMEGIPMLNKPMMVHWAKVKRELESVNIL